MLRRHRFYTDLLWVFVWGQLGNGAALASPAKLIELCWLLDPDKVRLIDMVMVNDERPVIGESA